MQVQVLWGKMPALFWHGVLLLLAMLLTAVGTSQSSLQCVEDRIFAASSNNHMTFQCANEANTSSILRWIVAPNTTTTAGSNSSNVDAGDARPVLGLRLNFSGTRLSHQAILQLNALGK